MFCCSRRYEGEDAPVYRIRLDPEDRENLRRAIKAVVFVSPVYMFPPRVTLQVSERGIRELEQQGISFQKLYATGP